MPSGHHQLEIIVRERPAEKTHQPIYVTGDFNNWDPADSRYLLKKKADNSFHALVAGLHEGTYHFKFTRGSWETVEVDSLGGEIPDRSVCVKSDSILSLRIEEWKDNFPGMYKVHAASPHVSIMDAAFLIPQLGRTRRIWLYLPPGYASTRKRFPVIYMHDGQNLFDPVTSFSGEWGIDEVLDTMRPPCIVVGIDNGGVKRMNEYNVYEHPKHGRAEGRQYLEFIVKTLKPYIDLHYRTLRRRQNTLMAGSSMGGLISFFAGLYYPEVFGKLGILSPSFHAAAGLEEEIRQVARRKKHGRQKYFFYAGGAESKNLPAEVLKISGFMREYGGAEVGVVIREEGKHNEAAWKKEFPVFYHWIMK